MYGEGRNWRYIIGFGLLIVLLFVVILLIVKSGNKPAKVPETQKTLTSYTDDPNVTVVEHIIGPISATQTHNEVEIQVTNQTASINVTQGYDGNVINSRDYPMSSSSFGEFLNSLQRLGFTRGNTDAALKNDQGYCPSGERYIFEVRDGATNVERFWATSCGGTPKTYKGNLSGTLSLFQKQIPDYNSIVDNINISSSFFGL